MSKCVPDFGSASQIVNRDNHPGVYPQLTTQEGAHLTTQRSRCGIAIIILVVRNSTRRLARGSCSTGVELVIIVGRICNEQIPGAWLFIHR